MLSFRFLLWVRETLCVLPIKDKFREKIQVRLVGGVSVSSSDDVDQSRLSSVFNDSIKRSISLNEVSVLESKMVPSKLDLDSLSSEPKL